MNDISGLRASNFIFLVCVWSSGKWRTRRNHWICIEHVASLRYKLPQNLHRFRDVIFENFRVRMTSFYLTKLFSLSNFDCLYLRQYWSYEQASKHRSASFQPEKGFWTSSGCHWYSFNDPQGTPSQMYSTHERRLHKKRPRSSSAWAWTVREGLITARLHKSQQNNDGGDSSPPPPS